MRPYQYTTTAYPAADEDSISLSQSPAGAGNLTINGALASGGVATMAPAGFITITSLANLSGRTFTATGTSPEGWPQTLAITGPNATTVTSTLSWATVTQIAVDAATGAALTVGTAQSGYGEWLPLDIMVPNQRTTIQTTPSGTINYTWEVTADDIWAANPALITAFDHPDANLVAETTAKYGSTDIPFRAVRFKVNSGGGTARNVVAQQSTQ